MLAFLAQVATDVIEEGGWGSSPILAAALFLLGFVFIVAEIFTITFGLFTLCAIASFAAGLLVAWNAGLPWFIGFCVVAAAGIPSFIAFMLRMMPHTRWGRKLIPEGPKAEDVTATGADATLPGLLGKEGRTLGMLRPSGVAEIDGKRYDVVTEGMSVNPGRPVKVVQVEGNRVVVREME